MRLSFYVISNSLAKLMRELNVSCSETESDGNNDDDDDDDEIPTLL